MQITEWARNILEGEDIADKLVPISSPEFTDTSRHALPDWPNRNARLQLSKLPAVKNRSYSLKDGSHSSRGSIFHFFANHELLALELMALALLKFPEAPLSFKRGLLSTMIDEQRHLALYIKTMNELGLDFGDMPLNSFFWRVISPMKTPEHFLANMSLTFEQANLDYAKFYLNFFAERNDEEARKVLQTVYDDEISHVAFGYQWLAHYKPTQISMWDYYQENLLPPITPSRGKGQKFDLDSRRKAGLDEDFIHKMNIFNRSKGKPPVLHIMNLGTPGNKVSQKISEDLSTLFLWIAGKYDSVLLKKEPHPTFLKELSHLRPIPEIILTDSKEERVFESLELYSTEKSHRIDFSYQTQKKIKKSKQIFDSKEFSVTLQRDLEILPNNTIFTRAIDSQMNLSKQSFVIKGNLSSSGQGHIRVKPPLDDRLTKRISKMIHVYDGVSIEPQHNRCADFSILFDEASRKNSLRIYRTICSSKGQFQGFWNRESLFPEKEFSRIYYGDNSIHKNILSNARSITNKLRELGYSGRGSIDGYLYYDDANKLTLRPMCEVNCRWTMGHFFKAISRDLPRPGVWLMFTKSELKALDVKSFVDLLDRFRTQFSFCLPCNDPYNSSEIVSFYLSDKDLIPILQADRYLSGKCF